MNSRERILALGVVGVIGLLFASKIVQWTIVRPFQVQKQNIAAARARIDVLDGHLIRTSRVERDWTDITERTLDTRPDAAHSRFRADVLQLLERHGFAGNDLSVKQMQAHSLKNGVVELPIVVAAKGKLKDLVGFLADLERREYIAKIDRLTLSAEELAAGSPAAAGGRGPGRAAPPDPNGPTLSINLTATTIVVPKIAGIQHKQLEEIRDRPDGLPRERSEYDRIAATNIFKLYVEPARQPERPAVIADSTPADARPPAPREEAKPPPPDPRKDAGNFKIVGTHSHRGEAVAYVRDGRATTQPPAQYRINDPVDDGVLLLIHPRGIVVRSTTGAGKGTDFLYRIGDTFADRVRLDPATHPDVARDLELALRPEPVTSP